MPSKVGSNCPTDIHADGSVELFQRWRPGGAQGNADQNFVDGDQYLFAVRLAGDSWEFHAVIAKCCPELGCDFATVQGDPWDWSWSEVEWFVPCADLDLPYIADNATDNRVAERKL